MKYNIISVGKDPKDLKFKFIKNARAKYEMVLSGFTQIFSDDKNEKSYIGDIPPMTLFFNSHITDVNNNVATKVINIYDIKDDAKSANLNSNINDLIKINITLKLSDKNECLDVDIKGVNQDNKAIVSIADSLKNQYEQMKKLPDEQLGIGGSWSYTFENDIAEYTHLFTLRENTNSRIKYDSIMNYICSERQLSLKNTPITSFKEYYGSGISNTSIDIATGDSETKSKSFCSAKYEMLDMNNKIMSSEQTLLTIVEFTYDNPILNVDNIIKNIKDDKFPKMYS